MIGIALTLLAVLLVICLAFCYSDPSHSRNPAAKDMPFLDRPIKKKN
jgi:hypothetical protein